MEVQKKYQLGLVPLFGLLGVAASFSACNSETRSDSQGTPSSITNTGAPVAQTSATPSPSPTQTATPSPTPTVTATPSPSPTSTGTSSGNFSAPFTPSKTVTVCASGCDFNTLSQAIASAQDYERIQVQAGTYSDCASVSVAHLWIQGVGNGFAHFQSTVCARKGILVADGQQLVLDQMEFSGMSVSASDGNNGAGVRHEAGALLVRNSYFHDGQEGILSNSSPAGTGSVEIQNSHFARLGVDGYEHDMYIGNIGSFKLTSSLVEQGNQGNVVKSRAWVSNIQCNLIKNGYDSTYQKNGYLIDLPNGGEAHVKYNTVAQGSLAPQHTMIEFGAEGLVNPTQTLEITGNNLINDYASGGTIINVPGAPTSGSITGNLVVGPGTFTAGSTSNVTVSGNTTQSSRSAAGLSSSSFPMPSACSGTIGTITPSN